MSNFERRLSAIHKRPSIGPNGATSAAGAGVSTSAGPEEVPVALGWEAAERISRILDVEPGTTVSLTVRSHGREASLEVEWDRDGVAVIRER
jgi:hypothetical protein